MMTKIHRSETDPALEKFTEKFSLPKRPGAEVPDLPRDLDELSDADLMSVLTEFVAWASFAKAELVKAEIEEERTMNQCKIQEATSLLGQWDADDRDDRVTIAKARRDTQPRVVATQEAHRQARAYRKLVDAMFDRCERASGVLSRELSRRISMGPKERQLWKNTP